MESSTINCVTGVAMMLDNNMDRLCFWPWDCAEEDKNRITLKKNTDRSKINLLLPEICTAYVHTDRVKV